MGVTNEKKLALDWITGTQFEIGDIVTRVGDDLHRIIDINDAGDLMLVECIRRDRGVVIDDDGRRSEPCYDIGDQEWNLPRRYSYPEFMTIKGEREFRETFGITDPGKTRTMPTLVELFGHQMAEHILDEKAGAA